MKIGIFDSGLGGLVILKAIRERLPEYDYLYYGDTKHLPYGDKSPEEIYELTLAGVEFLLKQDCALIILACNTASAQALRRIQQDWLPLHYPARRVLGVIIPTAEAVCADPKLKTVGILATQATVASETFIKEIAKLNPELIVVQQAAPKLVPLIENGRYHELPDVLEEYIPPLLKAGAEAILLGCTHYPLIREAIEDACGSGIRVIAQTDIVPASLATYLTRHPELAEMLTHGGSQRMVYSDPPGTILHDA